jgi:quinol monooxygenase YgiN
MGYNSKSITVVISCLIKPDKTEMAKQSLNEIIKTVLLKEKACQGIRVHEQPDNSQRLLIIEYWDSKEIFVGPHMQTQHMVDFFKVAETFLDGKAEFNFWNEILFSS